MTKVEIAENIKKVILKYSNDGDIKALDSFDFVQIIIELEEEYEIEFDESIMEIDALLDINHIAKYIWEKKCENGSV